MTIKSNKKAGKKGGFFGKMRYNRLYKSNIAFFWLTFALISAFIFGAASITAGQIWINIYKIIKC